MAAHVQTSLTRVWAITVTIFLVAAATSRALTGRFTPLPAYVVGVVGLLAVGVALVMSWRALGVSGAHPPAVRRALRGVVALGAVLWFGAMLFPFL